MTKEQFFQKCLRDHPVGPFERFSGFAEARAFREKVYEIYNKYDLGEVEALAS